MSFENLLNEYRRRAGIPLKEQLTDPGADRAESEERQYVNKISAMFRRIHDAAERGYQETKHEGFAEILRALGVMRESITEAYNAQEGEAVIYLADEEDPMAQPEQVRLYARFTVEPTEYEGPYVFYQGGVSDISNVEIAETFEFMGRTYQHSQPFPDELIPHVVTRSGDTIHGRNRNMDSNFYEHLASLLGDDLDIPSHRYPDQRSV